MIKASTRTYARDSASKLRSSSCARVASRRPPLLPSREDVGRWSCQRHVRQLTCKHRLGERTIHIASDRCIVSERRVSARGLDSWPSREAQLAAHKNLERAVRHQREAKRCRRRRRICEAGLGQVGRTKSNAPIEYEQDIVFLTQRMCLSEVSFRMAG